jgi:hypothetical protein
MHACMHNSPMCGLTLHALLVEQVALPESVASCTGKRECMEGASTYRGSEEHACMHAQFTHVQTYLACILSGTVYVAGDLCFLQGEARVSGNGQHASKYWRACMHAQFTHVQTYSACIHDGTGGVAGDLCKLHGEAQVNGGGQRASRRWRICMHYSPML